MGSGKTTVGPLVAERLGWTFVDVDDVIAAEAGTTIPEIFRSEGETEFRRRERETIESWHVATGWYSRSAAEPSRMLRLARCFSRRPKR